MSDLRPGTWAAPAVLVASLLLLLGALVSPQLTVWLSGGTCERTGGDSTFGELVVQPWPYGTVCTFGPGAPDEAPRTVGPSPGWTLYLAAGVVGTLGAVVVCARRPRRRASDPLPARTALVWLGVGAVGGALATSAVLVALVLLAAPSVRSGGSGPDLTEAIRAAPLAAAGGLVSGGLAGLLLSVPVAVVAAFGVRRGWPTTVGSWALLGAGAAGPASLLVTIPVFGAFVEPTTGVLVAAAVAAVGCSVVGAATGAAAVVVGRRLAGAGPPTGAGATLRP